MSKLTRPFIMMILLLGVYIPDAISNSDEIFKALDLSPNIKNGKKIYPLCASCHQNNGWGKADGSFPVIAGQHRKVLIKQLADIRSKVRDNPVMFPFSDPATIGGAQSISDLAAYIASLPGDPETGKGSGEQLAVGEKIYTVKCSQCHGLQAQGDDVEFVPRLKGQHYAYLLRQMQSIGKGERKGNPTMNLRVKALSLQEMEAVADFISRR